MLTTCSSKMDPNPWDQLPPNTQAPTRAITLHQSLPKANFENKDPSDQQ